MNTSDYETKYIKVLDGIRALSIIIIVWFHIWQQSWLIPYVGKISLDFIPRFGFLLVDMMILLSSVCLFIPYARSKIYGEEIPSTKKFYIKRIARIFPSYYLSMIIALIFIIILKDNWFNPFFIKDTIMHLFFVQNWSIDTLLSNNYMVVLWTVALEVQFYLIYPFIAKRFMKKPIITYFILMIIGGLGIYFINSRVNDYNLSFYVNHFLTFIPVYANGMLATYFYILYTKKNKRKIVSDIIFTIISISCIIIYIYLCKGISGLNVQRWQLDYRVLLSFLFTIFVVSTLLASKIYQKIFNNKLMKFIATISFNLYIYHQFIAVKLKELKIPFYSGDELPNVAGNKTWQWEYTILCIVISVIVAIIMTYLVEKPLAKLIKKKYKC